MQNTPQLGGAGHDRGPWLVLLLLLLAVLAPTAGLLWFMNQAATAQRDLAQRKLQEAWRAQLTLVCDRLNLFWDERAAELDRQTGPPAVVFERVVRGGLADAVVSPAYPSAEIAVGPDPGPERKGWLAARALEREGKHRDAAAAWAAIADNEPNISLAARAAQAQVRCLVRAGDRRAAVREIGRRFSAGRLARATDLQGRLIAADAQLLARQLVPGDASRLRAMVADYSVPMPSAQRLFLMEEMGGTFPTLDAERLAARFLEARQTAATEPVLRPSGVPDVWKFGAPGGRIVALYRTATIAAVLDKLPSFAVLPPGAARAEVSAAVPRMPGWQVTQIVRAVETTNVAAPLAWVGLLAIAAMGVLAVIAGQAIRRQWRLARLKTDLAAAVSHELKTPVASVRALADTLLDEGRFEPQKTREYLELIAHENQRLTRVIENFLTFSRMERRRQKFAFAPTRPEPVVEAAVEATRERWQDPQSRLEVKIAPDIPTFSADEDALVTVLVNLLDNAWKYTPEPRHITLSAHASNGHVAFSVADNGIGIAPRERKRIFRRFYQVDRRLTRRTGGCGLGLSIVDFIAKAHGGTVAVESCPGAGSTFTVSLPVSQVTA